MKKFLTKVFIYAIGNLGAKILTFFLFPVLSFFLLPSELGIYDLMLASIGVAVPFFSLQLSDATYRWLIMSKADKITIISSALLLFFIFSCLFSSVIVVVGGIFEFQYLFYFLLLVISNSLLIQIQQIARGLKKTILYSFSGVISALLLLILSIILLPYFRIIGLFFALCISQSIAVIFLIFTTKLWKYIDFKVFDLKLSKEMLSFSLPYIPNLVSWWIISVSGKFVIEHFISLEANGIFSISTRFASIVLLINSLFLLVFQDDTLENSLVEEQNQRKFAETFNMFAKVELSALIFLSSLTPFIFDVIIAPEYSQGKEFLSILYLASAFSAFSAYIGLEYQRKGNTLGIAISTIYGIFLCVGFTFLFIQKLQLFAPAIGSLLGFISVFLARVLQTKQKYIHILIIISLSCLVIFEGWLQSYIENNIVLLVLNCIISFFIFLFSLNNIFFKKMVLFRRRQ